MWNIKFNHKTLFYILLIQTKKNEQTKQNCCKSSLKSLIYLLGSETTNLQFHAAHDNFILIMLVYLSRG